MSTSREVVKYMALPYNGITAAIKWRNNDDMLRSDRGRYTAHGKECGAEGPAQRVGEAGREPRTGAGLCEQRRPEEDTQGMSTVVTKSG